MNAREQLRKQTAVVRPTRDALFVLGGYTMHSGGYDQWKIECDALTDADIECLAFMLNERLPKFAIVYGIPEGGLRLMRAMERYRTPGAPVDLIVDDVLTTGASMNAKVAESERHRFHGAVLFARGPCPSWVTPLFTLAEFWPGTPEPPTRDEAAKVVCFAYTGYEVMAAGKPSPYAYEAVDALAQRGWVRVRPGSPEAAEADE